MDRRHSGRFTMGSPKSEADRNGDEDQVLVTLTEPLDVRQSFVWFYERL